MDYETIYNVEDMYESDSGSEREYARETGGVCSGMVLEWLRLTVRQSLSAASVMPDVATSRELQQYVENDFISLDDFPEVVGLVYHERWDFDSLDEGLEFVWQNEGSYIIIYMPTNEDGGHAFGFLSESSFGYLLDPTNGCYRVHSESGLVDRIRAHSYVEYNEGTDMKVVIMQVAADYEWEEDDSKESVQYETSTEEQLPDSEYSDSETDSDESSNGGPD